MSKKCPCPTAEELRSFDLFKDDDDAALRWLAERFEIYCYDVGETVAKEGSPADRFSVVLEGELQILPKNRPYLGVWLIRPGEPTGVLPFSRMKTFRATVRATKPSRIAAMNAVYLRELVYRVPCLTEKLVWEMTDRAREFTQLSERNSKMLALGKLSAGLAHELNNPASSVVRSATKLRELIIERRNDAVSLRGQFMPEPVRKSLEQLAKISTDAALTPPSMDDLERSDAEYELSEWLEGKGLHGERAAELVAAGITSEMLGGLVESHSAELLNKMITLVLADQHALSLIAEIEESSRRMSQLLQDVKAYSYMDTSSSSEIDVAEGIKATLRMFQHQLKNGFTVKKELAPNLPKICANGNELNQVWTNLIDNAIDAMEEVEPERKILRIRTTEELDNILVEISDGGVGIPADLQGRIFEPFFTTKKVGQGTGLGLDIVARIVRNHNGSIDLSTSPNGTSFQVRLPKPTTH